MNRETKRLVWWFGLTLSVGFFIFVSSCKKDGPTIAVIEVKDASNKAVQGANVTLWQDTAVNQVNSVQSKVRVTKKTDGSGIATFEFKLESFLNVTVIFNTDTAKSFVRLKEHETVTQTVHI